MWLVGTEINIDSIIPLYSTSLDGLVLEKYTTQKMA